MSSTIQAIRGMHDILPADIPVWQFLEDTTRKLFSSYGYEEIRVPLVEKTALFSRAIGEATDVVEKEMYTFDDRNADSLSLRPEGTAGVVRAALQNGLLYGQPTRLWYQGAMFRHERPQKGRTRQFHQIGAEVFGYSGPGIDAELLALCQRLWQALGLTGLRLELNSLGNSDERGRYRESLVAYMQDHAASLDEESLKRLEKNPLRILDSKNPDVQEIVKAAPVLADFLEEESTTHFEQLKQHLDALGVEYIINPKLVRGLDYYSHTVFEWITDELGAQGTVCAGGRYDRLIEIQGGKPWTGIGFAMGQERLVELIKQQVQPMGNIPHGYLVIADKSFTGQGLRLAEDLRSALPELHLVVNTDGGSMKAQFKRADRSRATWALVMGHQEVEQGFITVKPLRAEGEQQQISLGDLSDWLKQQINNG